MATEVKVGQVYRDKDKRMKGRHVVVGELFSAYSTLYTRCFASNIEGHKLNKRTVTLAQNTLQTRFELVKEC